MNTMQGEAKFIVTITTTEPPPNWYADIHKRLARELELMCGKNATVVPFSKVGLE